MGVAHHIDYGASSSGTWSMTSEQPPPLRWLAVAVVLVLGAGLIVIGGDVTLRTENQATSPNLAQPLGWQVLVPGLEWASFLPPEPSAFGDSRIRIARVDPAQLEVVLLSATHTEQGLPRTARDWAETEGLLAVLNASMYAEDHLTSIHLMKTAEHTNNGRLGKDKAVLVMDPKTSELPAAQILDRECGDFDALGPDYRTKVQSIRMLGCSGENVWAPRDQQWSHSVIGQDANGRLLLIHSRSPWSTHQFIDILMALPLELVRLQYAEGGPPAQLFVQAGSVVFDGVGMSRTPEDGAGRPVAIPNVIGVRTRSDE
jgi:hypothetical protein